jgi:ComF family protein
MSVNRDAITAKPGLCYHALSMRGAAFVRSIGDVGRDLLSIALPRHCPGCEDVVESNRMLCDACAICFENLRQSPCCRHCASPIPDDAGPCGRCKDKGLTPFRTIARLTTFESITRDLVHGLKYGRRWSLVSWLASELVKQPRVMECVRSSDIVVPVPLHWMKRLSRGFNQAELLAHELARIGHLRVANAVRRVEMTTSQTAFHSRMARRRNLRKAFVLTRPDLLDGKRVLVVDDVMTSGATLQAVARTIRHGCKPAEMRAVVLASANPLQTDLAI